MKEGLHIVVTPGSRWATLSRIGWLRHVAGDEWEIVGARSLTTNGQYVPLAEVMAKGPTNNPVLGPSLSEPEPVHRLQVVRLLPASPAEVKLWAEEVPKPKGWVEK